MLWSMGGGLSMSNLPLLPVIFLRGLLPEALDELRRGAACARVLQQAMQAAPELVPP
jgi:hypothetical protein